ncbi:hypothetical protein LCGC14_0982170 [marine sediment metagenome]|uniref:Uncharacterized protein n=1 Tax=marine sediment metagenome TaxID=412755 RepID=A0A0F9N8H9_9ZZZZ
MRCTTCRSQCRKTTTVYVDSNNGLKRARVCNVCLAQTVRLFMAATPSLCDCGEPATTCEGCVSKRSTKTKVEHFAPVVVRIRGMGDIATTGAARSAYEQSANIIEAEAKRNA